MAAKRLTVIADDDNDGALIEAGVPQPGEETIDLLIDEGDFAIVQTRRTPPAELGQQRLGRLVWRMRIVEMDPGEERRGLTAVEPAKGGVHDLDWRAAAPPPDRAA